MLWLSHCLPCPGFEFLIKITSSFSDWNKCETRQYAFQPAWSSRNCFWIPVYFNSDSDSVAWPLTIHWYCCINHTIHNLSRRGIRLPLLALQSGQGHTFNTTFPWMKLFFLCGFSLVCTWGLPFCVLFKLGFLCSVSSTISAMFPMHTNPLLATFEGVGFLCSSLLKNGNKDHCLSPSNRRFRCAGHRVRQGRRGLL